MQAEQKIGLSAVFAPQENVATPQELRRFFLVAGTAYGLIFGLGVALLAWGRDAWLLHSHNVTLAWSKLLLGLPLAVLICGLAGWLSARSDSMPRAVVIWALVCGLLGLLAGRLPYDGGDLAAWLAEGRLWGQVILPVGSGAAIMGGFAALIGVILGLLAGGLQQMAMEWAWDRSVEGKRMSLGSWGVLLACLPVALFLAQAIEMLVNQPMRGGLLSATAMIEAGLIEQSIDPQARGYNALRPFIDQLSPSYSLQLVQYDPDVTAMSYIDATFENGLILRCATVNTQGTGEASHTLLNCVDFSDQLSQRMDDLVYAGLYGQRRWLADEWQKLLVPDSVVAWLKDHSPLLSETYEMHKDSQQGEWIFISTRFDSGFEMVCRFQGRAPLVVEECWASEESATLAAATPEAGATAASEPDGLPGVEIVPVANLAPQIPWLLSSETDIPMISYISFNTSKPPFDDPLVRQAFALATDRQLLLEQVNTFANQQADKKTYFHIEQGVTNAHQAENSGMVWFTGYDGYYFTSIFFESRLSYQQPRAATTFTHLDVLGRDLYGEVGLPFDPASAQQTLAQAGYPQGQGFPQESMIYLDTEIHQIILSSLVNVWRNELGVDIKLEPLAPEAYTERIQAGDVGLVFNVWAAEYNDPDSALTLFRQTGLEWQRLENQEFNDLLNQAAAASDDPAARQALYIQAERILCQMEALVIPVVHHYLNR